METQRGIYLLNDAGHARDVCLSYVRTSRSDPLCLLTDTASSILVKEGTIGLMPLLPEYKEKTDSALLPEGILPAVCKRSRA